MDTELSLSCKEWLEKKYPEISEGSEGKKIVFVHALIYRQTWIMDTLRRIFRTWTFPWMKELIMKETFRLILRNSGAAVQSALKAFVLHSEVTWK